MRGDYMISRKHYIAAAIVAGTLGLPLLTGAAYAHAAGETSCTAQVVTSQDTAFLGQPPGSPSLAGSGPALPPLTVYVTVTDPDAATQADCDEDIAYEGTYSSAGDQVTPVSALPGGLRQDCTTGSGAGQQIFTGAEMTGAWYGTADATIWSSGGVSDVSTYGIDCTLSDADAPSTPGSVGPYNPAFNGLTLNQIDFGN